MSLVRQRVLAFCRRDIFTQLCTACVLAALAFVLTFLMPVRDPAYYSFFLAAVAGCGILAGWKSALGCTVISAALSNFFFVSPAFTFSFSEGKELWRFLGFCGAALLVCFLTALLDTSRRTLSAANRKAKQAEDELARSSNERELLEKNAKFWIFEMDLEKDSIRWTDVYNGIRVERTQPVESWLAQVHEADRKRVRETIQEALVTGEFESRFRFYVRAGEREPRSVLGRARVVVRDGKSIILRGINVDLTTASDSLTELSATSGR